jgi:hypothetical protein
VSGNDPFFGPDFEPFSMGVDRNSQAYVLFVDIDLGVLGGPALERVISRSPA